MYIYLLIHLFCVRIICLLRSQCDLTGAVHQLIADHPVNGKEESANSDKNMTISVSQFPALAAGCVLYLSSPGLVCSAVKQGRWGEETQRFLHEITHEEEPHQHQHQARELLHDHEHEHVDIRGLKVLLEMLRDHYEPVDSEVSTRPRSTELVCWSANLKTLRLSVPYLLLYFCFPVLK